ncbi:MlaD family protein [Limnoglobus roseus]|uniref:MCE family protein n=1 Tax=Limnoglobus roseus TaxID=2598579 RepID=A0A5C1ALN4_9BACT|nr:MlaD family protein [Limnoglobus roseus]QEL20319.1 MCE family protein [Limnoglobus roseus]
MAERSAKLRLGVFMAMGLFGLAGLAILFGGAPRLFDNREIYVVTFGEAPGLAPGTPVRKSGVRIGEVTALDLDQETGQVKATIRVDKRYLPRQNEEATIFRGLLSGDTSLDFIPKVTADGQPVTTRGDTYPVNVEITGQTPINPNTLVRQASGVLPSAQESMARILNSVQRVEQAVPKVEQAFIEIAGLARSSREFVPELRRTNEKVQAILAFADPQGGNEKPGEAGLKTTLNDLRDLIRTAKPLVEDLRKVIKDNESELNATLKAVRTTAEEAKDLLSVDNRKAFSETLKNVSIASDDFIKTLRLAGIFLDQGEKTLKEFNGRWPRFDEILTSTNSAVKSADSAFKSADSAMKDVQSVTKPLAESTGPIFKNVGTASDELAKTLVELRATIHAINRSDGTLQKVITDPTLYNQLNESALALTRTLQRAEKVAADLQVFSDKVARRPELIGVGGALKQNSGLKESPSATTREEALRPTPLPPTPVGPIVPAYRQPLLPRSGGDLPPR